MTRNRKTGKKESLLGRNLNKRPKALSGGTCKIIKLHMKMLSLEDVKLLMKMLRSLSLTNRLTLGCQENLETLNQMTSSL
jgi:hypothetical protein